MRSLSTEFYRSLPGFDGGGGVASHDRFCKRKGGGFGHRLHSHSGTAQPIRECKCRSGIPVRPLVRKRISIFFCPSTILRHCLHRRSALGPARAGSLHLGFGHASARFVFQARANVYDFVVFLVFRWGCRSTGRDEHEEACRKHRCREFRADVHSILQGSEFLRRQSPVDS
jgi:hypothetical protein